MGKAYVFKFCRLVLVVLVASIGAGALSPAFAVNEMVLDPNDLELVPLSEKSYDKHKVQVRSSGETVCIVNADDYFFLTYKLKRAIEKNMDVSFGHVYQSDRCLMYTFEFEAKKSCNP